LFSDGFAESHPTHEVDFRMFALKQAQILAADLARVHDSLTPSNIQSLNDE
jgi:hypothetical protein